MTQKVLSQLPYYWVRIPPKLVEGFRRLQQHPSFSWDFNQLATLVSKEDMFHLIYEQTVCPDFVNLQMKCGVTNITQLPENILWLEDVKNEYLKYVSLNENLAKIKENRGENPFSFQSHIAWMNRYRISSPLKFKQGRVVLFEDEVVVKEPEVGMVQINKLVSLKQIRRQLRTEFLDVVGYMIWRTHPLTKWALHTSDEY